MESRYKMEESVQQISEALSRPDIIGIITSIATLVAAGAAAFSAFSSKKAAELSQKSIELQKEQLRQQNKQAMFEKRLEVYLLCKIFYNLISENQKILDIKSEHDYPINVDFEFSWITNTDFFDGSPKLIFDIYNEEYRYKFLQKLEELGTISEKCSLLFKNNYGEELSHFISSYSNALRSMYSYQIILDKMRNDPTNEILKTNSRYGKTSMMPKDAKQLSKEYGETKHRKKVLGDIAELKKSFKTLKDIDALENIKKQLIL